MALSTTWLLLSIAGPWCLRATCQTATDTAIFADQLFEGLDLNKDGEITDWKPVHTSTAPSKTSFTPSRSSQRLQACLCATLTSMSQTKGQRRRMPPTKASPRRSLRHTSTISSRCVRCVRAAPRHPPTELHGVRLGRIRPQPARTGSQAPQAPLQGTSAACLQHTQQHPHRQKTCPCWGLAVRCLKRT